MKNLNLYKITDTKYHDYPYERYDRMIVCAWDEDDAESFWPNEEEMDVSVLKVICVGTANSGIPRGMIVGSYLHP